MMFCHRRQCSALRRHRSEAMTRATCISARLASRGSHSDSGHRLMCESRVSLGGCLRGVADSLGRMAAALQHRGPTLRILRGESRVSPRALEHVRRRGASAHKRGWSDRRTYNAISTIIPASPRAHSADSFQTRSETEILVQATGMGVQLLHASNGPSRRHLRSQPWTCSSPRPFGVVVFSHNRTELSFLV